MIIDDYVRILKETELDSFSRKDNHRTLHISYDLSRREVTVFG